MQQWRVRGLVASCFGAALLVAVVPGILPADESATGDDGADFLARFKAAAHEREQSTSSLLVIWKQDFVFRKLAGPRGIDPKLKEKLKDAPDYPSIEILSELRISGDRFDYREVSPQGSDFGMVPKSRRSFDGTKSYDLGEFATDDPTGILSNKSDRFELRYDNSMALCLIYRAVDPRYSHFTTNESTRVTGSELVDGVPCRIVETVTSEAQGGMQRLWVGEADLLPRRFTKTRGESLQFDLSILYGKPDTEVPGLKGWRHAYYLPNGDLDESLTAEVVQFQRNIEIPVSEFQIQWPPGTLVLDEIATTQTRLPGGTWHKGPLSEPSSSKWLLWFNLAAVAVLLVAFGLRRWSKGPAAQSRT